MNATLKRAAVLVIGWSCVLLGIAGLFLPVLQGVLFILIGLAILSSEYIWAHHLLRKLGERFPRLHAQVERAREAGARWLHRVFGSAGPGGPASRPPSD